MKEINRGIEQEDVTRDPEGRPSKTGQFERLKTYSDLKPGQQETPSSFNVYDEYPSRRNGGGDTPLPPTLSQKEPAALEGDRTKPGIPLYVGHDLTEQEKVANLEKSGFGMKEETSGGRGSRKIRDLSDPRPKSIEELVDERVAREKAIQYHLAQALSQQAEDSRRVTPTDQPIVEESRSLSLEASGELTDEPEHTLVTKLEDILVAADRPLASVATPSNPPVSFAHEADPDAIAIPIEEAPTDPSFLGEPNKDTSRRAYASTVLMDSDSNIPRVPPTIESWAKSPYHSSQPSTQSAQSDIFISQKEARASLGEVVGDLSAPTAEEKRPVQTKLDPSVLFAGVPSGQSGLRKAPSEAELNTVSRTVEPATTGESPIKKTKSDPSLRTSANRPKSDPALKPSLEKMTPRAREIYDAMYEATYKSPDNFRWLFLVKRNLRKIIESNEKSDRAALGSALEYFKSKLPITPDGGEIRSFVESNLYEICPKEKTSDTILFEIETVSLAYSPITLEMICTVNNTVKSREALIEALKAFITKHSKDKASEKAVEAVAVQLKKIAPEEIIEFKQKKKSLLGRLFKSRASKVLAWALTGLFAIGGGMLGYLSKKSDEVTNSNAQAVETLLEKDESKSIARNITVPEEAPIEELSNEKDMAGSEASAIAYIQDKIESGYITAKAASDEAYSVIQSQRVAKLSDTAKSGASSGISGAHRNAESELSVATDKTPDLDESSIKLIPVKSGDGWLKIAAKVFEISEDKVHFGHAIAVYRASERAEDHKFTDVVPNRPISVNVELAKKLLSDREGNRPHAIEREEAHFQKEQSKLKSENVIHSDNETTLLTVPAEDNTYIASLELPPRVSPETITEDTKDSLDTILDNLPIEQTIDRVLMESQPRIIGGGVSNRKEIKVPLANTGTIGSPAGQEAQTKFKRYSFSPEALARFEAEAKARKEKARWDEINKGWNF